MRSALFVSSLLFLACGEPGGFAENEHCRPPQELQAGVYVSVPKAVNSKFPLAAVKEGITLVISDDKRVVDISYTLGGKVVEQRWRAQ
jgi:hypothetical protein